MKITLDKNKFMAAIQVLGMFVYFPLILVSVICGVTYGIIVAGFCKGRSVIK
jgi:hypothetical protein